jgi:hypothetical protein
MNRSDERKEIGAGMARTRGEAHHDETRIEHTDDASQKGESRDDAVHGGRGIMHESVEAENVIGTGGDVGVASAEGESDMASGKANRKEAMEPEREENEKAAMGRDRTVAHKNTMSHGERETVGRHTI